MKKALFFALLCIFQPNQCSPTIPRSIIASMIKVAVLPTFFIQAAHSQFNPNMNTEELEWYSENNLREMQRAEAYQPLFSCCVLVAFIAIFASGYICRICQEGIDPDDFLNPDYQTWPTLNQSEAEALLAKCFTVQKKPEKLDNPCAICLKEFSDEEFKQNKIISNPCQKEKTQIYHTKCIFKWLTQGENGHKCPFCRHDFFQDLQNH